VAKGGCLWRGGATSAEVKNLLRRLREAAPGLERVNLDSGAATVAILLALPAGVQPPPGEDLAPITHLEAGRMLADWARVVGGKDSPFADGAKDTHPVQTSRGWALPQPKPEGWENAGGSGVVDWEKVVRVIREKGGKVVESPRRNGDSYGNLVWCLHWQARTPEIAAAVDEALIALEAQTWPACAAGAGATGAADTG
jgi:hypothetical protein